MKSIVISLAVVLVLSASGLPRNSYAGPLNPESWTGLTFSRAAPTTDLVVTVPTRFVLRAERDVTSLQAALSPASSTDAGTWEARVVPLPATEEVGTPKFPDASRAKPLWLKTAKVRNDSAFETTLRCSVPRRNLVNWLLLLSPKSMDVKPVRLTIRGGLVDQGDRIRWLMNARSKFSPEEEPGSVRELIGYLTDQEVLHWASLPTREIFLLGWRNMSIEQMERVFGTSVISRRAPPHSLPNGLNLLMNWNRPVKDPMSVFLPETVPASLLKLRRPADDAHNRQPSVVSGREFDTVMGLNEWAPTYLTEIHEPLGERLLQFRIHPNARSIALHLQVTADRNRALPYHVTIECTDTAMKPSEQIRPVLQGRLSLDPMKQDQPSIAVFRTTMGLRPRKDQLNWLVRIRSVASNDLGDPVKQESRVPLSAILKVFVDATPINAREIELMAWRERIDPLIDLDAVRETIASLSDDEVNYYTHFPTREAFLKHWMRTKAKDLTDGQGRLVTRSDTHALTSKGRPLPNGKYLHHNGSGIPLD